MIPSRIQTLVVSMRFWELNKKVEINLKFSNKGVNRVIFLLWIGSLEFANETIGKEK